MDIQTNCKLEIEDDVNYFVECSIMYLKKFNRHNKSCRTCKYKFKKNTGGLLRLFISVQAKTQRKYII